MTSRRKSRKQSDEVEQPVRIELNWDTDEYELWSDGKLVETGLEALKQWDEYCVAKGIEN